MIRLAYLLTLFLLAACAVPIDDPLRALTRDHLDGLHAASAWQ